MILIGRGLDLRKGTGKREKEELAGNRERSWSSETLDLRIPKPVVCEEAERVSIRDEEESWSEETESLTCAVLRVRKDPMRR